jgi:hypothetical protein
MGMTAEPVRMTMRIDPDGDTQSGIELKLQ